LFDEEEEGRGKTLEKMGSAGWASQLFLVVS
jgi:hypothetical protein